MYPTYTEEPYEGDDYTMTCTVLFYLDLQAQPVFEWIGPDGTLIYNGSNITVQNHAVVSDTSVIALTFFPLSSSHGGEYSCVASIKVPYLNETVSKAKSRVIVVTSKYCSCKLFNPF